MYRKTKHSTGTETGAPITRASQQPTGKLKLSYKTHHSLKESLSHPDPPKNPHMENLPREGRSGTGAYPNPTPTVGPTNENWKAPEILLSTHYAPQAPDIWGEVETGRANEPEGAGTPLTEKADHAAEPPPEEKGTGQPDNVHSNLPQSITTFLHLSRGRIEEITSLLSELSGTPLTMEITINWLGLEPQCTEISHDSLNIKLIDGLSEDPEDHPVEFIPIIKRHNARLKKAHLLLEATQDIIQQRWTEGTTLEDIGKFLQSWAPEPYRNKSMPK